ncbi:MAG: hypothetical protein JW782_05795 [Candidatus Saganbacteria bacterium]|nr:hypothetical protein [Candidatus Saganbacteria bacterium]
MIDSYSFGNITINGLNFNKDLVLAWPAVLNWWRKTSHEVRPEDVEPILALEPKTIIFGTGDSGAMKVLPETLDLLKSKGIEVQVMPTGEAVIEYNRRSGSLGLVAAFHLTC